MAIFMGNWLSQVQTGPKQSPMTQDSPREKGTLALCTVGLFCLMLCRLMHYEQGPFACVFCIAAVDGQPIPVLDVPAKNFEADEATHEVERWACFLLLCVVYLSNFATKFPG